MIFIVLSGFSREMKTIIKDGEGLKTLRRSPEKGYTEEPGVCFIRESSVPPPCPPCNKFFYFTILSSTILPFSPFESALTTNDPVAPFSAFTITRHSPL